MKFCSFCHKDFPDEMKFCTNCGRKLAEKVETSTDIRPPKPPVVEAPIGQPDSAAKPKKKAGTIIKRILVGIAVVVIILVLWGMHIINSTTYLTFNSQGELFAKSGGTAEVNIDYDGYLWEVNYKPSWIEIDEFDNSFIIHCNANTSGQDREDHITIKSGKIVQTLPVGQYGSTQYIHLSESSVNSDMDGCRLHVDIETDGCEPEISYPEFCRIEDESSEGFTLVVNNNDDGYSRSGSLYVREDNVQASLYIKQEGKCINCSGKGKVLCHACSGNGFSGWGMYTMQCHACGGTGMIQCYSCGGTGIK